MGWASRDGRQAARAVNRRLMGRLGLPRSSPAQRSSGGGGRPAATSSGGPAGDRTYGIHASNDILFNHEGPTRDETFVTRKITRAVASIVHGLQDRVYPGNLNARRDWGHARDYVDGMWRIVDHDPDLPWSRGLSMVFTPAVLTGEHR